MNIYELDDIPENLFLNKGTIDEVKAAAGK